MRTIEVYHLRGDYQKPICRMWFLNDNDFQDMATRLTTAAPFNSLRRGRFEVVLIRLIYQNGFETEYYTERLTNKMLNICTVYMLVYGTAKKIAQTKGWRLAWRYASPAWRHRVALKQMRRASKLLDNH